MILDIEKAYAIFYQSVEEWHASSGQPKNPFEAASIEARLYEKNQIDTRQWHFEDEIRDPARTDAEVRILKKKIDEHNQNRTDLVEQIDDFFYMHYKDKGAGGRLNTETPAWALDRLSILALKIYHMLEQVERPDADEDHRKKCAAKLEVLQEQRTDLIRSLGELIEDFESGAKQMKLYRQMKMYNDPKLNPELYKNK